jgi:hypothetical protein
MPGEIEPSKRLTGKSKGEKNRRPAPAGRRHILSDLLEGMTPQATRDAFDWGPDKGREEVK